MVWYRIPRILSWFLTLEGIQGHGYTGIRAYRDMGIQGYRIRETLSFLEKL
jgi:hypothetical protein